MSGPSASTEPALAVSEPPPSDASGRGGDGSRDIGARAMALVVGAFVGMFIGIGIGVGIGNAARKRIDRWSHGY